MAARQTTPNINATADKLVNSVKDVINTSIDALTKVETIHHHELIGKLDELKISIDLLTKELSEKKKKPAPRTLKADATTEEESNTTTVTPIVRKENKLVYFRKRFKEEPEFREKYIALVPGMQQLLADDPTIKSKKKEDQKLTASAHFFWAYIRQKGLTEIQNAIQNDKETHNANIESANKPMQEEAETDTPPKE
jgi:hypothetical protein